MKQKTILAAALLCFSTAVLAAAPAWLADFNKADLNDSGGLSKLELGKTSSKHLDALHTHYEAIDADRDGHVTVAEYEAWLARQTARLSDKQFVRADLNDSGGLSRVELDKSSDKSLDTLRQNFDRIDRDRDGHLTYAEYTAFADAGGAVQPTQLASPIQPHHAPKDQCQPNCGIVQVVDHYNIKGEGSVLGAIAGGVAGGVLGNQVGGGTGKKIATVGGAAGGAYLGHRLEAKMKTKKMVRVFVRFDNGEQKDFDFEGETSPVAVGDRVQIIDGKPVKYTGP
jgi:outer membrane lipoprotein SlyB